MQQNPQIETLTMRLNPTSHNLKSTRQGERGRDTESDGEWSERMKLRSDEERETDAVKNKVVNTPLHSTTLPTIEGREMSVNT